VINGVTTTVDPLIRPFPARKHFEFRRDTSCDFHVHVSTSSSGYSIDQLRLMAKAVCFWEPAATRCAPPSRQDRINQFCSSNIKGCMVYDRLRQDGPLRGLYEAYRIIDSFSTRDEIVDFICEDKYRAWNSYRARRANLEALSFGARLVLHLPRRPNTGSLSSYLSWRCPSSLVRWP
jgi:Putative amidoligase enzyme